jgi:hypothetical protein
MAKKKDVLSVVTKFYEIKEAKAEDGVIEGYASVFENVDNSSDRMMKGCFSRYLTEQKDNNLIKLTYNHRDVIGKTIDVTEDDSGLFFRGQILKTSKGLDVLELVKGGALSHMSIKFAFRKDGFTKNEFGGRDFKEVKIMDCSVVDWPDNEMTSVSAKDYDNRLDEMLEIVSEIRQKLYIAPGQTLNEAREALSDDFREHLISMTRDESISKFGAASEEDSYPSVWIEDVYENEVVVSNYWAGKLYRLTYSTESGKNVFGEPVEVVRKVSYVNKSGEPAVNKSESARGGADDSAEKSKEVPDLSSLIEKISMQIGEIDKKNTVGELDKLIRIIENKL